MSAILRFQWAKVQFGSVAGNGAYDLVELMGIFFVHGGELEDFWGSLMVGIDGHSSWKSVTLHEL